MANTGRVDKTLFAHEHYLGKPADVTDKIISRRISILEQYPYFFRKDKSLLEIGCGGGATITRVANRFSRAWGIDVYDYKKEFETNVELNKAEQCYFRQIDLEKESLQESFDRIISFEVIEHFQNEDTVASFYSMLNPDGYIAISVPNKWWIFETHGARLPLLPWNRVPFFSWLPRKVHERYANARIYTRKRIVNLLQKHGFKIIGARYITAPMDVLKDGWLKRMLTKHIFRNDTTSVPMLSTSVFVIAKKSHPVK